VTRGKGRREKGPAGKTTGPAAPRDGTVVRMAPHPADRVWRQLEGAPRAALEHDLSQADLQTLLLDVTRQRAAAVTSAGLMRRWRQDRYVTPSASDPRAVSRTEARLWELLPAEFTGIELSPVTPLGTCAALGPVSQNRVISTIRGSEVVSDPTNVLALEAAWRRREAAASTGSVHLACCQTVLRGQPFDGPGHFQHFRLFALVTSARDRGSAATEASMLTTHLKFWTAALGAIVQGREATVSYTVFGFQPLAERIKDTVLPALQPLPGNVALTEDPDRQHGRGYYERGAIKLYVDGMEIGDGGFTDWTARLNNDAKERCFTSCLATGRLAALTA
jgi:hypothetical protein